MCGGGVCRAPEDIIQVAAGYASTCALRASGEVLCWGSNWSGILGDGTLDDHITAMPAEGLTDAVQIDANNAVNDWGAMCARRMSGALACWGSGAGGQLGIGSEEDQLVPVEVVGVTEAASVNTAQASACALRRDGSVWCWGIGSSGQLGVELGEGPSTAAQVVNLEQALQLDVAELSCVTLPTGEVACWGYDRFAWAGDGSKILVAPTIVRSVSDADSVYLPGPGSNAQPGAHCVIHAGGTVSCTGENDAGNVDIDIPHDLINGEMKTIEGVSDAIQVAGTLGATCALRANGRVVCWGTNTNGELGTGSFEQPEEKVVTVLGLEGVVHLAGGRWHMCAALGAGGVACWGANQFGQLGDGTTEERAGPVPVLGLP